MCQMWVFVVKYFLFQRIQLTLLAVYPPLWLSGVCCRGWGGCFSLARKEIRKSGAKHKGWVYGGMGAGVKMCMYGVCVCSAGQRGHSSGGGAGIGGCYGIIHTASILKGKLGTCFSKELRTASHRKAHA